MLFVALRDRKIVNDWNRCKCLISPRYNDNTIANRLRPEGVGRGVGYEVRKRQQHTGCRSAFSDWVQRVSLIRALYDWVSIFDLNLLQVQLTEGQMRDWYQSH